MKIFLVFDSPSFHCEILEKDCRRVELFPLTANWDDINLVVNKLKSIGIESNLLNSVAMIDSEVSIYKDSFIEWAGAISNLKINDDFIRQWLLLSDKNVSAWWFGLLADKDPYKSTAFSNIVKTEAILKAFKKSESDIIILALKDFSYRNNLCLIFNNCRIKYKCIKVHNTDKSILKKIKYLLRKKRIIKSFYVYVKILLNISYLKLRMPSLKNRIGDFNDSLLVFSYFPSVIREDALMGRFRNRFTIPLQDICCQNKKDIVWLAFYGNIDGYSFKDAISLAKKFIKNKEKIYFYLEFIGFTDLVRTFLEYLRILFIWKKVRFKLNCEDINKITGNSYAYLFILEALDDSFYGPYMLMGIIQYEAFKKINKNIKGFSHCIYLCEMFVWEYAFIAAMRFNKATYPLIGYQHSSIPSNQLSYFHSRQELKYKNTPDGIPMPEIIACNGSVPQEILKKYYDEVENLEALRYLYVNEYLKQSVKICTPDNNNRIILMVCTSFELEESKALVNLVKYAYPEIDKSMEIWFKGHPSLSIQKIFNEVGINISDEAYKVKEGHISTYLKQCNIVLVGGSTVAIEALIFGCEILVYYNSERLDKSPLSGFDDYYHKIYDPESLRSVINNIKFGARLHDIEKKREFVKRYWNLNPSMDGWKKILQLG